MAESMEQFSQVLVAATDAATDSMVERFAASLSNMVELVDLMSQPDTRDALAAALDGLTRLHKSGDLAVLFDMAQMVAAAQYAATDGMVERGASLLEYLVSNVANEEVADLARQTQQAICQAREETAGAPKGGGMMSTLKLLGQPETQESLRFLVRVAAKLRCED